MSVDPKNGENLQIIIDARVLANVIFKNGNRTGIYFSALNFTKEIARLHENTLLFTDVSSDFIVKKHFPEFKFAQKRSKIFSAASWIYQFRPLLAKRRFLRKFMTAFLLFLGIIFKNRHLNFSKNTVFFSPFMCIPPFLRQENFKKFILLHDCTPVACPQVFTSRGIFDKLLSRTFFFDLAKDIRRDYGYFANSFYTKADFLRFFPVLDPEDITVTHLAADEKMYFVDKDDDKNARIRAKYGISGEYFFSLHTITTHKNLHTALRAFLKMVIEKNLKNLVFAMGGAQNPNAMKQIMTHLADFPREILKNHVKFLGYVDDADVANLFSHAITSVYLSEYEGFGMPALEALACGCPVVASNTTSLPEVVGDAGILCAPHDVLGIKNAFQAMVFDKNLRDDLAVKAVAQVAKFSWEKSAKIMIAKFKDAI